MITQVPEDEINLIEYILVIFRYKWFILVVILLSMAGVVAYNTYTTPQYQASCSFFLPTDSSASSSPLAGYAQLLGGSAPANIGTYITMFTESDRLKSLIASDMTDQFHLSNDAIIGKLNLGKKLKLEAAKNGAMSVSYEYSDPKITVKVLESYLKNIVYLNQYYNLSPQREIFVILDPVKLPKSPSKPNKKLNLIIGGIASFFLSIILVFIIDFSRSLYVSYKASTK